MLKSKLFRFLPKRLQYLITARVVDRFNRAALLRFQQAHCPTSPVERDLHNGIAVVIPCYNHAAYLEDTLASLGWQTYRPFEAIFVEDHSSDDTWARLQCLCPQLPNGIRPTLLHTPRNSGQAFAINLGVATSQASVFMILNDDDYLMHDALEATLEILHQNTDLFLFGTTAALLSGGGCPQPHDTRLLIRNTYPDYTAIPLIRYAPTNVPCFNHPNDLNMTHSGSTFFKTAWQAVGGYYPDKSKRVVAFSDRDFQLRVASLFPVAVSMEVPFVYWRSGSSVDHGKNS